jgi:hypothetical protein
MSANRKFIEAPLYQGPGEEIAYELTTTPWGSSPTGLVCEVKVKGGDATSTLLSTSVCTSTGDVITTGRVKNLQDNAEYEMTIGFTIGANVFRAFGEIQTN